MHRIRLLWTRLDGQNGVRFRQLVVSATGHVHALARIARMLAYVGVDGFHLKTADTAVDDSGGTAVWRRGREGRRSGRNQRGRGATLRSTCTFVGIGVVVVVIVVVLFFDML